MAVDDLWYSSKREYGPDGKKLPARPTKRHGRGNRYRVRYEDETGSGTSRSFPDGQKRAAEDFDASVRTDVARGVYIDPAAGKETVDSYHQRWSAAQLHAPSSAELIEGSYRRHVRPVLGRRAMSSVQATHIQALVTSLDLAPSTVRTVYGPLAAMFRAAAIDRVIAASPCTGIRLPPAGTNDHVIPTPDQVHALYQVLPERVRALVYIGAGCGLRHGEALGLEMDHVDFLRREIHVVQQLTVVTGRSPHVVQPKTKTSRRVVELPKVTATALARHLEQFPIVETEVDDETNRRKLVRRTGRFLFTNTRGRPVHRSTWSRTWAPVVQSVGLPEGTGFHSLRHYFATLLIHNGASVKTVQTALGHSNPMVTLNTYVGMWPDQIDRTRTLVDDALGSTPDLVAL